MEHIAAFMILVGCSAGNVDCREVEAPAVAYETAEECLTLLRPALSGIEGRFPVVLGQCATVDPALFLEDATISWSITANGRLDVAIVADETPEPVLMAGKTSRISTSSN